MRAAIAPSLWAVVSLSISIGIVLCPASAVATQAVQTNLAGTGSISPAAYQVTLNGSCALRYLRTRTAPVSLPAVAAPPQPPGTRNVTITSAGQSIGGVATLRNLRLNGNVGLVSVPPGTYGNFTVNCGSPPPTSNQSPRTTGRS